MIPHLNVKNTKLHTNHQIKQEESFQNHILRSHHWPCHYRHDPSFGKPIRVGGVQEKEKNPYHLHLPYTIFS